jgi:hypothetical protein
VTPSLVAIYRERKEEFGYYLQAGSSVVIKGSGHWLMAESADQVMPQIIAFFK